MLLLAVIQSSLATGHSYVSALRAAIVVPVVALLAGAGLALALRGGAGASFLPSPGGKRGETTPAADPAGGRTYS